MKVTIQVTQSFARAAKPLLKKYPSLRKDLLHLESSLKKNPRIDTPLGNNVYKIRLQITGKGKGKSGGARVISYVESIIMHHPSKSTDEAIVNPHHDL